MGSVPHLDGVVTVTVVIFIAGLIYDAGVKAQRLTALEQWRQELRGDILRIGQQLDRLADLIRGRDQ